MPDIVELHEMRWVAEMYLNHCPLRDVAKPFFIRVQAFRALLETCIDTVSLEPGDVHRLILWDHEKERELSAMKDREVAFQNRMRELGARCPVLTC